MKNLHSVNLPTVQAILPQCCQKAGPQPGRKMVGFVLGDEKEKIGRLYVQNLPFGPVNDV